MLTDNDVAAWRDRALQAECTTGTLRSALRATEAERIALADAFRATLESQGMHPVTAALHVQGIINEAAKKVRR